MERQTEEVGPQSQLKVEKHFHFVQYHRRAECAGNTCVKCEQTLMQVCRFGNKVQTDNNDYFLN